MNSGANFESSWAHAVPPKQNAVAALAGSRASMEYAASDRKCMFSFPNSEPIADVPSPGFTKKGLQHMDKENEAKYLKVSPLKIESLPAITMFKEWRRHFCAEVAGATQTADETFQWIGEVEAAENWEDLDNPENLQSVIQKCRHPCWKT